MDQSHCEAICVDASYYINNINASDHTSFLDQHTLGSTGHNYVFYLHKDTGCEDDKRSDTSVHFCVVLGATSWQESEDPVWGLGI